MIPPSLASATREDLREVQRELLVSDAYIPRLAAVANRSRFLLSSLAHDVYAENDGQRV